MPSKPAASATYDADSITHMEDVEHVRHLPDMYIGDTGQRGLHHLISEIVNNSVDEVMEGGADRIWITLHADNSISVRDNGRGIPPGINEKAQVSGIELAMTKLKAGGKFGNGGYRISGGLHGVGLSCVNFLSEWCTATVWRDNHIYHLRCEHGLLTGPIQVSPVPEGQSSILATEFIPWSAGGSGPSGTILHWLADTTIFGDYEYDIDRIVESIRYICYLARNATVELVDERGRIEPLIIHTPRGIEQFVTTSTRSGNPSATWST